jgi:hypothetical protein
MNANAIIEAAMARRTDKGLRLEFVVPDRGPDDTFTTYCKDEAHKAETLRRAAAKGWKLVA